MKKNIFWVVLVMSIILSCDNSESTLKDCGVNDPIQELDWLKDEIAAFEEDKETSEMYKYRYVAQAVYKFQTVFYSDICCPVCDMVPIVTLKNCKGEEIGTVDPTKVNLPSKKTIWRAEGFPCN